MTMWSDLVPGIDVNERFLSAEYHAPQYRELERKLRSAHRCVPLSDLARSLFQGWSPRGGVKGDAGVPAIKTKNLSSCSVSYEMDRAELSDASVPYRTWAQHGDIYVLRCAHHPRYIGKDIGRYGRSHPFKPFITEKIIVARGVESRANDGFVAAFLQTEFGYQQIQRRLGGLTANYTPYDFGSVLVPLPDRRVQDYIGAKVELAERCRAVSLKSWAAATDSLGAALGVPLTPDTFEVKSAGSVSGSGYQVTSVRPVVALVSPQRLVGAIGAQFFAPRRAKATLVIEQSGLGAKRLSALADRFTKRVRAEEVQGRGLPYVGLAQVDSSTGYVSTANDEQPSSSSASFGARDILFSKLRPYLNKVAICPEHLEDALGSTELVTYRARPGVDPYYVFFVLKSPLVLNQVIDITSGSTHPRVDPDLIDDVLVPMAEASAQKRIGRLARAALELMRRATLLVEEAKADVQALIEGTLDVKAILAGTLKAPTADDIPELAEDGT
jgi:type I restriction enzyme S subunit